MKLQLVCLLLFLITVSCCDENGALKCIQSRLPKLASQTLKDAEHGDYTTTCKAINEMLNCVGLKAKGCSGSVERELEEIRSKFAKVLFHCKVSAQAETAKSPTAVIDDDDDDPIETVQEPKSKHEKDLSSHELHRVLSIEQISKVRLENSKIELEKTKLELEIRKLQAEEWARLKSARVNTAATQPPTDINV